MAQRTLDLKIDFRSGLPIYTQVVEQIRRMLASGELKPGDQLPTVRQLATDLRVNFNTIARAYRLLDEAGLISTQQGRGTYIWEPPGPETAARSAPPGAGGADPPLPGKRPPGWASPRRKWPRALSN